MKSILLVDDNTDILDALSMALCMRLKEYGILTADNGRKAVEVLAATPVDTLLTDLEMPVMDGFELIGHAKTRYPLLTVFAMTGRLTAAAAGRLLALGVDRYLEKPMSVDAAVRMITGSGGLPVPSPATAQPAVRHA